VRYGAMRQRSPPVLAELGVMVIFGRVSDARL
jgi:hypothetical protein